MKINSNELNLDVRLSPDEAWRRITAESEQQAFFVNPSKPFVYRISGNEITLEKVRHYRNDFSSSLKMKIYPMNYGCRLRGSFSVGIVPRVFLVLWLMVTSGLSLILIIGTFSKLSGGELLTNLKFPNFIPVIMFGGGIALFFFGRLLAKGEERKITEWLNNLFSDSIIKH